MFTDPRFENGYEIKTTVNVLPDAVMQRKKLSMNVKVPQLLTQIQTNVLMDTKPEETLLPTPIIPLDESPLVPIQTSEVKDDVSERVLSPEFTEKAHIEWLDDSSSVEPNTGVRTLIQQAYERAKRYSKNLEVINYTRLDKREVIPDKREAVTVDLSLNFLTKLPQFLIDCTMIAQLDLSGNYLTTIPDWLGSTMTNLIDINLSYNYLCTLPPSFAHLKLHRLNISSNRFEYIPYAVLQIQTLVTFDVSHNNLLVLPYGLSNLKLTLAEMNLAYNNIVDMPDLLLSLRRLRALKWNENKVYNYCIADVMSKLSVEEFKSTQVNPALRKSFYETTNQTARALTIIRPNVSRTDSTDSGSAKLQRYVTLDNAPHRQILLLSLLESEREYVRRLNILHLMFYDKIMTESELLNMTFSAPSVFPQFMFSLIIFCRSFYMDLKERLHELLRGIVDRKFYRHGRRLPNDGVKISDLFMRRLNNFEQFYVDYPTVYDQCRANIAELSTNNPDFSEFLKTRRDLPCCEGMTLENFLLLPIHRLSVYVETFQALIKHTDDEHPDAKGLRSVNKRIRDLLARQEKSREKVDNWHLVVNQSKKFGVPQILSSSSRTFIREGKLDMPQSKDLNAVGRNLINSGYKDLDLLNAVHMQVTCVLFSDLIMMQPTSLVSKIVRKVHIFDLNEQTELVYSGDLEPDTKSESTPTENTTESTTADTEFQLVLKDKNKVLLFNTETKNEKIEWCTDIAKVLASITEKVCLQAPLEHHSNFKLIV